MSGLNLGQTPIVADQEYDEVVQFWSTYDIAVEELAKRGYRLQDRPNAPTAEELNVRDPIAYSELFVRYSGWLHFIAPITSELEMRSAEHKRILTDIESRMQIRLKELAKIENRKTTAAELECVINEHPQVRKLRRSLQIISEQLSILHADQDNCETHSKAVSRNLEVRRQEIETMNRSGATIRTPRVGR